MRRYIHDRDRGTGIAGVASASQHRRRDAACQIMFDAGGANIDSQLPAIDLNAFQHTLHVVSSFGYRNLFNPVDEIYLGIMARVTIGLQPAAHVGWAGVIGGQSQNVGAVMSAK